ncbi:hypothetical protein B0H34DRAFT_800175 [Crassisporium funariophilum]|nr:hypothetical protein B0H34DRAFT_800175 [Crassisporium funariophilum]
MVSLRIPWLTARSRSLSVSHKGLSPPPFAINGDTAGKRTQSKWDVLKKAYRTHAASLIQTGGGVCPENAGGDENTHYEFSDCYIPPAGPDGTTTERAKNIWEQIINDFLYFPELHHLLATRPNFNPPAVTTGVGPEGHKTVHYQAPGGVQRAATPVIDPALVGLAYHPAPLRVLTTANVPAVGDNCVGVQAPILVIAPAVDVVAVAAHDANNKENPRAAVKTPGPAPKASIVGSEKLDNAVGKVCGTIKPLSIKRSAGIEDVFTTMSQHLIFKARYREEVVYKSCKLNLEEGTLLLQEKESGNISQSTYNHERKLITCSGKCCASTSPPSSPKRQSSPEWDWEKFDEEMESSNVKIINGK